MSGAIQRLVRWLSALIALGTIVLAAFPALATTTTVYKCFDRHLGLVYTDSPCKDGERIDIDPGEANPAAVAKLEHARDMLDRSAAERIADERRAALQRGLAASMRPAPEEDRGESEYAYQAGYYDGGYLAYPTLRPRSMRSRMARHAVAHRFAPNPPYHVPRQ
jgi:hypothetical protein